VLSCALGINAASSAASNGGTMTKLSSCAQTIALIEEERANKGISMRQLAESAGKGHNSYWWIVTKTSDSHFGTVLALANAVGFDLVLQPKEHIK
jgi:DNA-binding phage protein